MGYDYAQDCVGRGWRRRTSATFRLAPLQPRGFEHQRNDHRQTELDDTILWVWEKDWEKGTPIYGRTHSKNVHNIHGRLGLFNKRSPLLASIAYFSAFQPMPTALLTGLPLCENCLIISLLNTDRIE